MKTRLFIYTMAIYLLASACKSNETVNSQNSKNDSEVTSTKVSAADDTKQENLEKAIVSFKVNGIPAVTTKGKSNDSESHLGLWNVKVNHLSLDLLGDTPEKPHRGWLHFSIDNFKAEPATYTLVGNNEARFTRYETSNAGGPTDFKAFRSEGSMNINFTKVEKNEASEFGEEFLLSGTFSTTGHLAEGFKSEIKSIQITEGTFKDVPVRLLGAK